MRRLHILLTCSSLVLIALSVNRLTDLTRGYIGTNEFLRWVDFNAMLFIPLAIAIIYYLLKKNIENYGKTKHPSWLPWLNVLFVTGIFLFGVSSGNHETTNYLHGRFCDLQAGAGQLCQIIAYHDDTFSHVLYYLGIVLLTGVLLGFQAITPRAAKTSNRDIVLIIGNALIIALAVFANLAFEPTAIDIVAFTGLALLSAGTLVFFRKRYREFPIALYLAVAYGAGITATVAYKLVA